MNRVVDSKEPFVVVFMLVLFFNPFNGFIFFSLTTETIASPSFFHRKQSGRVQQFRGTGEEFLLGETHDPHDLMT